MNILILPSWYKLEEKPHRGSFFREQAIALQKYGNNVFLIDATFIGIKSWLNSKNKRITKYDDEGVTVYSFLTPLPFLGRFSRIKNYVHFKKVEFVLRKIAKNSIKIDIIHAHSSLPAGCTSIKLSQKMRIPNLVTEHSSRVVTQSLTEYERSCLKKCVLKSDKFISVSKFLDEKIEQEIGIKTNAEIIPNMVSPLFQYKEKSFAKKEFTFLSVGNLIESKGFKLTIRAFYEAFKGNNDVKLNIVGSGPQINELRDLVNELNMGKSINILGPKTREETAFLMQTCDVFILPSKFETFGVVYIEALASGKPVISTRNGGANEIINQSNGILIDIDDYKQLVNSIHTIYNCYNDYDLKNISEESNNKYSEDIIVSKLVALYEETLDRK